MYVHVLTFPRSGWTDGTETRTNMITTMCYGVRCKDPIKHTTHCHTCTTTQLSHMHYTHTHTHIYKSHTCIWTLPYATITWAKTC